MIYAVEQDVDCGDREAEWLEWHQNRSKRLLLVPGFRASQCFKSVLPTAAPYLTLHQVDSAAVFDSPEYKLCSEPDPASEWEGRYSNYRQHLFGGLGSTPDVLANSTLLMLEEARDIRLPAGISAGWLPGIGFDKSIGLCGFAVVRIVPLALTELAKSDQRVRIYRAVTDKIWETAE